MTRKENPGARGGATGAADCHSCKTDATFIILGGFYSNDSIAFEWAGSTRFAHGGLYPGVHGRYVLRATAWAGEGMA